MDTEHDRDLVRALSTKHAQRALEQILRKHGPMVMGVCRRALGDLHEAEDAFQATFIVLVRRRHSLTLKRALGAWLHGVALRIAMKAKAIRTQHRASSQIQEEELASRERDHAERISLLEIGRILDDEIQRLPHAQRTALVLCELEGYSHKDAAKELGIPPGTVSSSVSRAKETLRQRLTRRGITITSAGLATAISTQATAATISATQVSAALNAAALVLAGKTASMAATGAVALALADAFGRKVLAGKIVILSAALALALVGMAAAIVYRTSVIPNSAARVAPIVDPLMAAERAVMHLGEEAFRHRFGAARVTFLADGQRLATLPLYSSGSSVYLWDVATGRMLREFALPPEDLNGPTCLAVSPSGGMLAVGRHNGELSVLEVETGRLLFVERPDDRAVTTIAFTPDGERIIVGTMDGVIRVLSASELGRLLRTWSVLPEDVELEINVDERVSVLAISPDGQRVAVGDGGTGAIHLFKVESGERLTTIEQAHARGFRSRGQAPAINSLAFTAGGRQLISGGYRLVPPETTTLEHGPNKVEVVEARLWNAETGALVRDLIEVDVWGMGILAVSPDGETLVTGDADALRFWQVSDGSLRDEIPGLGQFAGSYRGSVAFSPDGATVAVPTKRGVTLWNTATARSAFHEGRPRYSSLVDVAWSERTNKLALAYDDGVELRNAETGRLERDLEVGKPGVEYLSPPHANEVEFSADGLVLVGAGPMSLRSWQMRGVITAWEATTGEERARIEVDRPVRSMALSDDASVVAVTTSYPGLANFSGRGNRPNTQLCAYELPSGKLLGRYPRSVGTGADEGEAGFQNVVAARIATGSSQIHFVCEDGFCSHWDFRHHRPGVGFFADERTDGRAFKVGSAVFSPDCKRLFTSGPGKLCVWNTETQTLENMEVLPHTNQHLALGISRDGARLVGADTNFTLPHSTVRIWELPTRTLQLSWQARNTRATSFAFSQDNTKLLTGLDRGTAMIWDVR